MELKHVILKTPVYTWEFHYCKDDTYVYLKEKAPCYFHRLMQRWILGVVWTRIK